MPTAYFIAGCNGAGKTTFAMEYLPRYAGCLEFVNADMIARGLQPFAPEKAAVQAGRLTLERVRELMGTGADFALETTLSGLVHLRLIAELHRRGYRTVLFYVWIPSAEIAEDRVKDRVANGGHDIPAEDIRRRYQRSLENLFHRYLSVVDWTVLFDNSQKEAHAIAEYRDSNWTVADRAKFGQITSQVSK